MTIWPKGSLVRLKPNLTKQDMSYSKHSYDVYEHRGHEIAELGHDWRHHHKTMLLIFHNPKEYMGVIPGTLELVYEKPC